MWLLESEEAFEGSSHLLTLCCCIVIPSHYADNREQADSYGCDQAKPTFSAAPLQNVCMTILKYYLSASNPCESAGQLAISHNTISRKHLTITLDHVQPGHAHSLSSRSRVTIEDLATKIGTVVNGQKIKGSKYVLDGQVAEILMGKCPHVFRLIWAASAIQETLLTAV
jgi:hypothetical protein